VDVAQNGTKTGSSVTMHMITRRAHARVISRILAQRSVYVRNTYKFKLGWKYILLEPMDLVTITDPKLGLNKFVVRIKSIDFPEEGSEEDGMEIEAEEWPFGCGSATIYATQNTGAVVTNTASDPGNANAPVIFDVPSQLSTSGGPELMVATAGGAIWGGCDVWVSADGSTYAKIGTITKPARYGTLVVGMASSGGASIDLSVSGGAITSVAASVATDLQSLMWVNGEIVSYSTATLTGGNAYTLTLPVRGTYGTLAAAHASGASIVRLDDAVFRYAVPASRLGATLYVKLQSFNLWGSGYQDLSACTAYTYAPTAQGTYANQSGASTTQTIINLGSMAANSTNMVKNGNSEDESPTGCQAAGVVASGAFAGLKCRSVGPSGASNTASLAITDLISVVVGDQYYLEAQAAGQEVGATAALQVKCYLADKTTLVGSALVAATMTGTAYAKISGSVTIPATAVWMQVFIADTNGVSYGALFDCLYMGKKISAGILEADLAVAGIIRSPNFTPGSAGASPVGYKASGALFTVTYMDGTTASANLEIGGSVSIGGFPAATIGVRSKSWTTPGTYDWPVPMGVYSVDVTLQAGGQGGRGYGYRTDSSVGNPGTGGMAGGAISFKYPVTQGQTLRFIVGAGTNGGSQVSGAGGVAGTTASVGGDTKFQYPAGTDLAIAKGDSSASYGGFSIPAIAAQNTGLQGTIGQFLTGSAVGGGGGGMCNGANQVGGYSGDKVTGCTTGGAAYNSEWISGGGGSSALGRGGNGVNLISTPNPGVSGSGGAGATRLSQSGARGGDGCIIIKW